tara:strand:+ start:3596 stop:4228 length:633 start_codon:yes stop_codon:yes gene_type:complete
MLFEKIKRVLIFAPHTDDAELGCGATIHKLTELKIDVFVVSFSSPPPPNKYFKCNLNLEMKKSLFELGINSQNIFNYDFQYRIFNENRQKILDQMIELREKLIPDLVFCPNANDNHQDHQVIHQETKRAFKKQNILGYELPWNDMNFSNNLFIKVSKINVDAKIMALNHYVSQKDKIYFQKNFQIGLSQVRGSGIGEKHAEAFEAIRIIF